MSYDHRPESLRCCQYVPEAMAILAIAELALGAYEALGRPPRLIRETDGTIHSAEDETAFSDVLRAARAVAAAPVTPATGSTLAAARERLITALEGLDRRARMAAPHGEDDATEDGDGTDRG